MSEVFDRLRLARTESVGPVTYRRLMSRFSSAAEALAALPELAQAGGRANAPKVPSERDIAREIEAVRRLGGSFVFWEDQKYSAFLGELADAPAVLSVLGDVGLLSAPAIGIVGARNASGNGMRLAQALGSDLAMTHCVVSGLARGIDTAAHEGALRAGRTVAVIAGGLDVVYPRENAALQAKIAASGAVVTEAPLGTEPQARHFPKRNRLIAGLVLGLVVVEAAARSGSLLTARLANEAGREIFAVPGSPLDPRAAGGNDLIRQGAHLTERAADVLSHLPDHPRRVGLGRDPLFRHAGSELAAPAREAVDEKIDALALAEARRRIPGLLGADPVGVDEIARLCQLSQAAVKAVLLELELAGRVETLAGNRVMLSASP